MYKPTKPYTLVGVDGNAFYIMGYVSHIMKRHGYTSQEVNDYIADAKSSDYNHLLVVSMDMIEDVNKKLGFDDAALFDDEDDDLYESFSDYNKNYSKTNESDEDYEDDDNDTENDKPLSFIKQELWRCIDNMLIDLWYNENETFSPEQAYSWVLKALDEYPVEQLSIFKQMTDKNELVFEDDLDII